MKSFVFYLIFTFASILSVVLSKAFAEDKVRFIETTGRAIIQHDETIDSSRRRALEDALYLAALHGGAKINGFSTVSTDTSIQENLVVQPSSQILDYTILSEDKSDTHFVIKIRSAVGQLKSKGCESKALKSLSIYKPTIEIDPSAPYWVNLLADELINGVLTSIKSASDVNLTDYSNILLDRDQLTSTNDDYDYISLTSGRERTQYGDYAAVSSISITERQKLVGFTTYNSLVITFNTEIYEGSSYSFSFSKKKALAGSSIK